MCRASGAELTTERALELASQRSPFFVVARNSAPAWIPGTNALLYAVVGEDGTMHIHRFETDTRTVTRLIPGNHPKVSPDGRHMAFVRTDRNAGQGTPRMQLWIASTDGAEAQAVTEDPDGISGGSDAGRFEFAWSPDSTRILFARQQKRTSGEGRPSDGMKPHSSARAYPRAASDDRTSTTLRIVDARTRRQRLVVESRDVVPSFGWLDVDAIYYERSDGRSLNDARALVVSRALRTGRESVLISGYHRQPRYRPVANSAGTRIAFVADPGEEAFYPSRRELAVCEASRRQIRVLTKDSYVEHVAWAPDARGLLYVDGPSTRRGLRLVDASGHHRSLTDDRGVASAPAFSSDGRRLAWIFTDPAMRRTIRIGRFDGQALADIVEGPVLEDPLEEITTSTTHAIEWRSADGLMVDGYLTLPRGEPAAKNLPLVVMLHGGPQGGVKVQDSEWPSGPYFPSLLAAQGYAVFRPDYRGSGLLGYDKILASKAARHLFRADSDDVLSGIHHLEQLGISDPQRTFIIGHSHGSSLVNWMIASASPGRFRAAVSYEGGDMLWDWGGRSTTPEQLSSLEWYLGGTPVAQYEIYRENSAIANISGASTPTLFVNTQYGTGYASSLVWLYNALRAQGVDSAFVHYPGELHVLTKLENQKDLLERLLSWLRSHDLPSHRDSNRVTRSAGADAKLQ